jgi:hypothetical protein
MVCAVLALFLVLQQSILAEAQDGTGPVYTVANTTPPDAYLALRTEPNASRGRRIAEMPNGTRLQVLQRNPDGWWRVRLLESGQTGWALSRSGNRLWIVMNEVPDDQDPAQEHDASCRGVITVNWTEGVSNFTPDNGDRLVRADDINNSCLFHRDTEIGNRILATCRMGHPCEVKARVNSDSADVNYIKRVYSVRQLDQ